MRLFALFLVLVGMLSACTFTYLPPVREGRTPQPMLTLGEGSGLERDGETLRLTLVPSTVPEPDWLAVQWFDPSNDQVAATSVWLEAAGETHTVTLPERVALESGLWRAVVSYQGRLVRQFSLQVTG